VTKLFVAARIEPMQSDKASNKTRKNVKEPVPATSADLSASSEKTAKPRAAKSSKPKTETAEPSSAMRHRKAATVTVPEVSVERPVEAPKAMAAASSMGSTASVVIDSVGVDVPAIASTKPQVSHERIQELAYEFWIADGSPHGKSHEYWLRAERELGLIR
jgi:Protein of unknown function (DUF2934)